MEIKIGTHTIGTHHPTYFIADIAANHDGDLDRAKMLIRLAQVPKFSRSAYRL
jgi:sialic acid synthase SpsE